VKGSGLGARFLVGGYDISGDTQALDTISGGIATLDVTDITQSAHSRLPGLRDGSMAFTVFFDKTGAHVPLSALPVADEIMSFLVAPLAVGGAGASLNAKQIGYDPSRGADGSLTLKSQGAGNQFGLEWGVTLTPGERTDTTATDGASLNNLAARGFGAQAYLQAVALTGTAVTVTVQHSPDNATWSTLMTFAAVTSAPQAQRISVSNTTTVDQYLRVITAGTFTSFTFMAMININPVAGVTF
jgi:hypothetical protein